MAKLKTMLYTLEHNNRLLYECTGKLEELTSLDRVKGVVVQRNGKRINGKRNIKHYR